MRNVDRRATIERPFSTEDGQGNILVNNQLKDMKRGRHSTLEPVRQMRKQKKGRNRDCNGSLDVERLTSILTDYNQKADGSSSIDAGEGTTTASGLKTPILRYSINDRPNISMWDSGVGRDS